MATLETAKDKWTRKTSMGARKWKTKVEAYGIPKYPKAMADFLGLPAINPDRAKAYEEGVRAVSSEQFIKAVEGKADKWATKLREAFE